LVQERLFGDTDFNKMKFDYKIPPQHNIQFYLKAMKPHELESFYKNSEYHLTKLINRTNTQLEYLYKIKGDQKRTDAYEKKNYLRFIGNKKYQELKESYDKESNEENLANYSEYYDVYKKFELLNKNRKREIINEVRILKRIDEHIKENNYNKFSLTPQQQVELNRIRKIQILKKELIDGSKSEKTLVKAHQEQKKDYKVRNYKNNDNQFMDGFRLNYSQKYLAMFNKENLTNVFDKNELNIIDSEIRTMESSDKLVTEYLKRKKIEDSLRKRKRYHLPALKRMKTSLDKYSNEDEYYTVKSLKKAGIEMEKKKDSERQINI
jgi:hypothetical protein